MMLEDQKHMYFYDYVPDRLKGHPPPQNLPVRSYLEHIKRIKGFLPPWWTEVKAEECAVFCEQTDDEFQWTGAWEEDHMQKWMDPKDMPMKLRMLANAVSYACTDHGDLHANEEARMALLKVMTHFTESATVLMLKEEKVEPDEVLEALNVYEDSLRLPT